MTDVKIILVEENRKKRTGLASFLESRGIAVEAAAGLPGPPDPDASPRPAVILVVSVSEAGSPVLAALRKTRPARTSPPAIVLAPPDLAEALLRDLDGGIVDQVVSGGAAGLYSAIRTEELKVRLTRTAAALEQSIRRLKREHLNDSRRTMELEEIYETTLENFMTALDMRDVETFGHSKTVARYSQVLAEALGLRDPETLDNIRRGALLHDAGKIAIPDAILKKPGPLTAPEWEKVRRHPALGYGLIKDIKLVPEVGNIILCHHERYDGAGYPRGLRKSAIPYEARIFAVADTLDAITSHRPYRSPADFPAARGEIIRNAGAQFDPRIVDAFAAMDLAVWERIRFQTTRVIPPAEDYGRPGPKR